MATTKTMAPLQPKQRKALPSSAFALPERRKFPIHDAPHARNAMARLEQQKRSMTRGDYARAKSNILRAYRKFGIKSEGGGTRATIKTAGLSIHVHHMSNRGDDVRLCRAVEVGETQEDSGPTWNQIAKVGQWAGHPAGPFKLGHEEFEQIISNFKATVNRRIPVDFEHASEADCTEGSIPTEGAPAQGWVTALENRGAEGLWGLFEWLEPAKTYIQQKKYRYLSPAIRFGAKDRVTAKSIGARLTSVALTNNPFLDGMAPLAASDREGSITMTGYAYTANEYMPRMRTALRMGETATARECLDRLAQLEALYAECGDALATHQGVNLGDYLPAMRDMMSLGLSCSYEHVFQAIRELLHAAGGMPEIEVEEEMLSEMADAGAADQHEDTTTMSDTNEITAKLRDAEAKVTTLSAREAELTLKLKDAESKVAEFTATLSARDAEIKALKDAEAERAKVEADRRVEEAFSTYKDKKCLSDADKKAMRIVLASDPATFETLYPRVAPAQQHLLRTVATDRREAPAQGTPAPRGQKVTQEQFRALKDKYVKEGVPLMDAIERATKELSATAG